MKKLLSYIFSLVLCISCKIQSNYLTDKDIHTIYNTFIKSAFTQEFKNRYVPLPLHKNSSFWRWEDKDFPRVIALLEFERYVVDNKIFSQKALAINGANDPEWQYLPTKQIMETSYVLHPEKHNLYTFDLDDKDFDFVMVNQTFEHIYDPLGCLKRIYDHMAPGGILYFNVPANTIPHDTPLHYYTGFTASGIGALVTLAGFKVLTIAQWGNVEYVKRMFETNDWPDYRKLKNPGFNDINCPVIVWVFAVK